MRSAGPNGDVLYVLNSDLNTPDVFTATSGSASIQGYNVSNKCGLTEIPGSHRLTTTQTSSPTTIAFNPVGNALAVAEPNTAGGGLPGGDIDVFAVDKHGVGGAPVVDRSTDADRRGRPARQRDVWRRGLVAAMPVEAPRARSLHRPPTAA